MTQQLYDEVAVACRERPYAAGPAIVVSFGGFGSQYARPRRSRRGTIQCRVWSDKSHEWTKWRKLQPAEIVRIATADDIKKFAPDYGLPWERNW